jgi:hypothetical protein
MLAVVELHNQKHVSNFLLDLIKSNSVFSSRLQFVPDRTVMLNKSIVVLKKYFKS